MAGIRTPVKLGQFPAHLRPLTIGAEYDLSTGARIRILSDYQQDKYGVFFLYAVYDPFSARWFDAVCRRYLQWSGVLPTSDLFSVGGIGVRVV